MNPPQTHGDALWTAAGWTMVHYLWLGTLFWMLLWTVMRCLAGCSSQLRYSTVLVGFSLLCTAVPIAAGYLGLRSATGGPHKFAVAEAVPSDEAPNSARPGLSADKPTLTAATPLPPHKSRANSRANSLTEIVRVENPKKAFRQASSNSTSSPFEEDLDQLPPGILPAGPDLETDQVSIEPGEIAATADVGRFRALVGEEATRDRQSGKAEDQAAVGPRAAQQSPPTGNGSWSRLTEAIPQVLSERVIHWLPWIWLLGATGMYSLLLLGVRGGIRLRQQTVLWTGEKRHVSDELSRQLGVRRTFAIGICQRVMTPVLLGIRQPLIVLPAAAMGWSPQQLEMVLVHEMHHIRRWDNLVNLFQRTAEGLLFFHPVVWITSNSVRREREHCCDDAVLQRTERPLDYARLLVSLADEPASFDLATFSVGSAMAQRHLVARVRQILHKEQKQMVTPTRYVLALVVALSVTGLAFGWRAAEKLRADVTGDGTTAATADTDRGDDNNAGDLAGSDESAAQRPTEKNRDTGAADETSDSSDDKPSGRNRKRKPIARELLRFDGKTFEAWVQEWRTELKPELRSEAIHAFATFAVNGYGSEAAEAIAEVMEHYNVETVNRRSPEGKLVALAVSAFTRLNTEDTLPVIRDEISNGNFNGQLFGLEAAQRLGSRARPLLSFFLELNSHRKAFVRRRSLQLCHSLQANDKRVMLAIRKATLDKDSSVAGAAIDLLVPYASSGGEMMGGGMGMDGDGGAGAGTMMAMMGGGGSGAGMMGGMPGMGPANLGSYFPELLEILAGKDKQAAMVAVGAFRRLGPRAKDGQAGLIKLLSHPDPLVQSRAVQALASCGATPDSLPHLTRLLSAENQSTAVQAGLLLASSAAKASTESKKKVAEQLVELYNRLPDSATNYRLQLINAFSQLGSSARCANPLLEAATRNRHLKSAALKVWRVINGQ